MRRFKKLGKSLDKLKEPDAGEALAGSWMTKLLGATSNAVERANRRFRKAQNSIYSVRTKEHLEAADLGAGYAPRTAVAPKRQADHERPA